MEGSLEERLQAYLSQPGYTPQDRSAIARGMGLSSAERAPLRALLTRWESEKKLLRLKGARLAPAAAAHSSYSGTIRVLPRGKRLFIPHEEGQQALALLTGLEYPIQVPIAQGRSMGGMDGDTVRARVQRASLPSFRRRKKAPRPESVDQFPLIAKVEELLERRREYWVGTYAMQGRLGIVRGDGKTAPARITLSAPAPPDALVGMLVVVQPETYPAGKSDAKGRITDVLGWPEDDGVDMTALIYRHGLRDHFGEAALQETLQLPAAPTAEQIAAREDWTQRCVVTIDPPTARDYDDAICVWRRDDAPGWELAVHIADVSYYVHPGSALDDEARRRGNSTYLPDRVLPMLPPRLCDDLCSLVQGEPRLTLLCHMRITEEGIVEHARLARTVICSRLRLTYPAVLALLESGQSVGDTEVDAMLQEASRLAQTLRKRRFAAGALNLDMPELRTLLDEHGRTVGFEKEESDISHQLVEEFMLAANEQVAHLLRTHELPTIYRVHEEPAADKWSNLAHTLREFGITASMLVSRRELVKVMERISEHPDEQRLKVLVLRSMMRARYSPQPLGHFGLAKGDYCHFTSPIRRYADLVVHRSVARLLSRQAPAPLSAGNLARLADHLSTTERQSAAAEAEALRMKLLQYMDEQAHAPEPKPWLAFICATWAHGIAIELDELQLRGYIPSAYLPRRQGWGYTSRSWISPTGARLQEGAKLWVIPTQVDWDSQSIDFRPAEREV